MTRVFAIVLPVLAAAGQLVAPAARAQCDPQEFLKVLASDAHSDLSFGLGIAIDGNLAVVGAPQDDTMAEDAGAAYVYRYDGTTWVEEAKLVASDGEAFDAFGTGTAIDGDVILIGAWWDSDNGSSAGAAYVFRYDGSNWNQEAKLVAGDPLPNAWFGYRVDLSGDVAIIGAWGDGGAAPFAGAAYIFRYDGNDWNQEAKLLAPLPNVTDYFGYNVAIQGDLAAVGSLGDDAGVTDGGAVHVYRYDGTNWNHEATLVSDDIATYDQLGVSVRIVGNRIFSGAYGDDDTSGAVYAFDYDGSAWTQTAKITASDRFPGDGFGWWIDAEGDLLLASSDTDDDNGDSSGSAYLYRDTGSGFSEEAKLLPSDGDMGDNFAYALGLSNGWALIGAPDNQDFGEMTGSAYFFTLNCAVAGDIDGDGDVDLADLALLLAAYNTCAGDPNFDPAADLDGSGCVDLSDLAILLAHYGG